MPNDSVVVVGAGVSCLTDVLCATVPVIIQCPVKFEILSHGRLTSAYSTYWSFLNGRVYKM